MENKKLWCVGICTEDDSPHEQSPAAVVDGVVIND